ncbi:hypothetical protein Agabi119p4_7306 [Agaricus bisporus var. burnettii]|uniref:ABM domain-containing protein n=1 Tax=Agaricus bisporus var. burnettii TaxID=192524 RepID=A0A8H7EYS9_AGABI|nr:hypothetical protein Agabi119p4_7306 [Agaricus bisporus var. burnettii]
MTVVPMAPEIIWFNPSEPYVDDPTETIELMAKSSSNRGPLGIYYGFDEQDPSTGVWVIAWKNVAMHKSFMAHETYVDFALPVMEAMIGSGEMTQILLFHHHAFLKAISSPITQFVYIALRPHHNRDYELEPLIQKLQSQLSLQSGCYSSSWGPSVEHDDMYVGLIGWRSRSDHDCAVNGEIAATVSHIRELGSVEVKFTRLQAHPTSMLQTNYSSVPIM